MNIMTRVIDDFRVPDSLWEQAYESTDPKLIAQIKTAIALADFYFGRLDREIHEKIQENHSGFWHNTICKPVDHVSIFFDSQYSAAARVCAAAILPVLCGVANVEAICIGSKPAAAALVALELCGVENAFCLPENELEHIDPKIIHTANYRAAILHSGNLDELVKKLQKSNILYFEERLAPRLYITSDCEISASTTFFLHGNYTQTSSPEDADVIFHGAKEAYSQEACKYTDARLVLGSDCAGFWIFPGYNSSFFMANRHSFGTLWRNPD